MKTTEEITTWLEMTERPLWELADQVGINRKIVYDAMRGMREFTPKQDEWVLLFIKHGVNKYGRKRGEKSSNN